MCVRARVCVYIYICMYLEYNRETKLMTITCLEILLGLTQSARKRMKERKKRRNAKGTAV